ncbi:hypothetical protein PHJA_002177500 [Phtheirospermum japonicum]|uniref:Uncharacterized protein n=1 Tax=Phtheirospermum japonicum TaxID=374723 RepID=A0A830CVX0_9LAMI|nr:hypothetical protein PHJA_002177500 [Phtheirospermum japonicum]
MIPAILSCPPAPRKPPPSRRCKRKMCDELEFFEIVATDEIDTFFRVAEKSINAGAKRRCVI